LVYLATAGKLLQVSCYLNLRFLWPCWQAALSVPSVRLPVMWRHDTGHQ